jgi:CyaY protein
MDEGEFEARAESALARVEAALEESGLDADLQMKEGGILEVEFADGSKLIVNRHRAAREIWVAARSGGFHFRWDGAAWRDTRAGTELFTALSGLATEQAGQTVRLKA